MLSKKVRRMNDATLVERRKLTAMEKPLPSEIKTILLHVQHDGSFQHRLETALSIARATGAHLQCIQVTPIEAYATMENWGGIFATDKVMEEVDAKETELRSEIEAHLGKEDVSWDYEQVAGHVAGEIVRRAALADLVVTGRDAHLTKFQRPELAVLGDILTNIRTPLLIPGPSTSKLDPFGTAVIAWNGSFEAANAVRGALGLLRLAGEVRVIRYTEQKEGAFPDTQLAEYLSRHGIHGEYDVRPVHIDYADELVEYADLYRAGFIVMGGYGHSRVSEIVFGGVTRALLRSSPVALLIAH